MRLVVVNVVGPDTGSMKASRAKKAKIKTQYKDVGWNKLQERVQTRCAVAVIQNVLHVAIERKRLCDVFADTQLRIKIKYVMNCNRQAQGYISCKRE